MSKKPMPAEIWVIFMLSLQQMLCVVPMHVNKTFSSFSHRKCTLFQKFILLESPERHEISNHGSNSSMSLIILEYTEVSEWPHSQNSTGLKSEGSCRPVDLASTSHPQLNRSLVHKQTIQGHVKTLAYSGPGNDWQVLQQQTIPIRRVKKNFSNSTYLLWEEVLKDVLTCLGTIHSICCRDNTKLTHISASTGFWTFVNWDFFAQNEYYTPCKSVNFFFSPTPGIHFQVFMVVVENLLDFWVPAASNGWMYYTD